MPTAFARTTRALEGDRSGWLTAGWCLGGGLLVAWLAWFVLARITVYEHALQARIDGQQAVRVLAAPVAGRVTASRLVLGQAVKAGDVLVELDAAGETARLREEQARLAAAGPRLEALTRQIDALHAAAQQDQAATRAAQEAADRRIREAATAAAFAEDLARRLADDSRAGGAAPVDALRAQSDAQKLAAAREALAADARRLVLDADGRDARHRADIDALQAQRLSLQGEAAAAEAAVTRLQLERERRVLRAPVDGHVGLLGDATDRATAAGVQPGAVVAEGQRLATIVPQGGLMIVADFPAAALGRIRVGQAARMRLQAYPWAQYGSLPAQVARVGGEAPSGRVRVELTALPTQPSRLALQPGQPGSLDVVVDALSPAMLVLRAIGQIAAPEAPVATTHTAATHGTPSVSDVAVARNGAAGSP